MSKSAASALYIDFYYWPFIFKQIKGEEIRVGRSGGLNCGYILDFIPEIIRCLWIKPQSAIVFVSCFNDFP